MLQRLRTLRSKGVGLCKDGKVILKCSCAWWQMMRRMQSENCSNILCGMGLAWPFRNEDGALNTETICIAPWQIGLVQDVMLQIAEKFDDPKLHTEPRLPVPVPPRAEPRLPVLLPQTPGLFAQPRPSSHGPARPVGLSRILSSHDPRPGGFCIQRRCHQLLRQSKPKNRHGYTIAAMDGSADAAGARAGRRAARAGTGMRRGR